MTEDRKREAHADKWWLVSFTFQVKKFNINEAHSSTVEVHELG